MVGQSPCPRKRVNGKQKGGEFERLICRKLSKWVTGSERPECFWRSASSGAKATQDGISGQVGDIIAIDHKHHMDQFDLTRRFIVECKSHKDFRWDFLIDSHYDKSNICKWWMELMSKCLEHGKMPMLIFKKNNSPIYVAMHNCVYRTFTKYRPYNIDHLNYIKNKEVFITQFDHLAGVIQFRTFINTVIKYDPFLLSHYDEEDC